MSNYRMVVSPSTANQHTNVMQCQTHTVSHPRIHESDARTVQDGIHNTRQTPSNIHAPSPSAMSWYSHDEDLSPRVSKNYSDLYTMHKPGGAEPPVECHATPHTTEARKASTVTIFPGYMASNSKPNDADVAQRKPGQHESNTTESHYFFKKRYQRAKEIYRNGPPGEGEVFWTGVRNYLKQRETGGVFEMCPPKHTGEAGRLLISESSIELQVAHRPLRQPPVMAPGTIKHVNKPSTRHDSAVSYGDISRTSREVPIKIRRTVLTVNTNQPLPPSPPLSVAPKRREQKATGRALDVNKPLPRTPFPCFADIRNPPRKAVDGSSVHSPWPPTHIGTVGLESAHYPTEAPWQDNQECVEHIDQQPQSTTWLECLTKKPSNTHFRSTGKSKPSKADKAHDALKAKISRPIPIPPTVNISPTHLAPHPGIMSEKAKGKQKILSSPTWLNKLAHPTMPTTHKPKKRPDSDESFACQGLGAGVGYGGYLGDGGLSVMESGPRMRVGADCEEILRPEPLFTGRRSDGSYYDVNDEWADQRSTGRWI